MNSIAIFIMIFYLFLVNGAPVSKDHLEDFAPNNTVDIRKEDFLPNVTHPILGRLHKIPQYLRRLKIDVENEFMRKIEPKLSIWPPFFEFSVEQPKAKSGVESSSQNPVEEVKPNPSLETLKILRILIKHVWKDAKALINKKMKGKDNEA
ncbi:uncharacterized protein [Drosophila takahashii]|uniref:uncharacterized protein isoform X2 n=1 Tax=Drosophila takahashii TaxID=29030 RepID=UPI00389939FD